MPSSEGENGREGGSAEGDSSVSAMPRLMAVERLGVDLDWKLPGSEEPLLCGGIVLLLLLVGEVKGEVWKYEIDTPGQISDRRQLRSKFGLGL